MIRINKRTTHELEWNTRKAGHTRLRATVQQYVTLVKMGDSKDSEGCWLNYEELQALKRIIDTSLRLTRELRGIPRRR